MSASTKVRTCLHNQGMPSGRGFFSADADVLEVAYLSDLYEGNGSAEVKVKVLRGNQMGDIVDQYV